MSKIGIAGLQLDAINGDNVDSMETAIDEVAGHYPWLDMVVLGEMNAYGTDHMHTQEIPASSRYVARKWPGAMMSG